MARLRKSLHRPLYQLRRKRSLAGRLPSAGMEFAVIAVDRAEPKPVPESRATFAIIQNFDIDLAFVRQSGTNFGDGSPRAFGTLKKPAISTDNLFGGISGEIEECLVGQHDRIVFLTRIGHDHRHTRSLDRGQASSLRSTKPCGEATAGVSPCRLVVGLTS